MADLMTLICPSCGGQLQVTNETDRFVCAHCGNSHIVDPGVRVESLAAEVEKLHAESRIRQLEREIANLQSQQNLLRSRIEEIRSGAIWTGCTYQMGTTAAFVSALALAAYAISELLAKRSSFVAPILGMAAFMAVMGVVAVRVYPTVKTTPNHDDQLQKLVTVERQIAQRQRELDTLQHQVNQSYTDDSISDYTQHATRNTQYASRTIPS